MMKSIRYYIPNCITLANLIAGCLAIYQVLVNGDSNAAAWCIVAAGVFDLFDGLVARLLHAQSVIGADLDSLSDVVSFGVAPAFLLFFLFGKGNSLYMGGASGFSDCRILGFAFG